jgi:hypothetical protein
MARAVNLTNENVDFSQTGKVVINDNNLANELIQNQEETIAFLESEIGEIDLSKISLDAFGRININDPEFLSKMQQKFSAVGALGNGTCGLGC